MLKAIRNLIVVLSHMHHGQRHVLRKKHGPLENHQAV